MFDGVSQITRPFCQLGSIILTVLLKVSSLNVFILLDECTTRNTSMIFHLKYLDILITKFRLVGRWVGRSCDPDLSSSETALCCFLHFALLRLQADITTNKTALLTLKCSTAYVQFFIYSTAVPQCVIYCYILPRALATYIWYFCVTYVLWLEYSIKTTMSLSLIIFLEELHYTHNWTKLSRVAPFWCLGSSALVWEQNCGKPGGRTRT